MVKADGAVVTGRQDERWLCDTIGRVGCWAKINKEAPTGLAVQQELCDLGGVQPQPADGCLSIERGEVLHNARQILLRIFPQQPVECVPRRPLDARGEDRVRDPAAAPVRPEAKAGRAHQDHAWHELWEERRQCEGSPRTNGDADDDGQAQPQPPAEFYQA